MPLLAREYTDLNRALDEVRRVIEAWLEDQDDASAPRPDTVRYTQLVLHEWIANLLQHADFHDRTPTVQIRLDTQNRHVTCVVIDNSEGFDLAGQLPVEERAMDNLPERGMGLRIIDACTDSLSYTAAGSGLHRFEFSIPADHDPWLSTLF